MAAMTNEIGTKLVPQINTLLTKNMTKYNKVLGEFISSRSKDLYDIGPYKRIYFGADDIKQYFTAIGISEADVKDHINKTYYGKLTNFNPKAAQDPFTVAQLLVIKYFLDKGKSKELETACIYLAFSGKFYPSIHYRQFPVVQPDEYRHVMDFVINKQLTDKYDLKREGSLIGAIRSICNTWVNTYKNDKFKMKTDNDAVYLIQQLHGRISSFMINIAELYYKAYDNQDYLNYMNNNYTEDGFRVADTNIGVALQKIENAMNVITTSNVNYEYCRLSADVNVNVKEVQSILESIHNNRANIPLIKEFLTCMVMEYAETTKDYKIEKINQFLIHCISQKPNTKDPYVIRQKEILIKFLTDNSMRYKKRSKKPDVDLSYRKALCKYYALIICKM